MAKGRRRAVAVGGARPRGGGPAGSSSGAAAAAGGKDYISAGVNLMGAHLGMHRMSSEQSEAIKRVIESSDVVDPDRAMKMVDDVNGSESDSSDNEEMEDYGPLHEAAGTGRMDTCKYLVEELGFDINADANNDSGMTPLACAVSRGKAIAVRYLLDKGANLNKQDSVGFSPLHYATKKGNDGLVRLLLSKGASADISSCEGTPLHVAVSAGNSVIVQTLLQHDADPNRVFSDLGTPMTAAVLCAHVISVAPGKIPVAAALKCMKLLVKAGAGLNCTTPDTPLVIATSKDLTECVQYLLEVGADANIPSNYNGTAPIEIAADSGRRELVEILFPYTKPIQCVSNWSVDGIITHVKSKHLKDKGKQSAKDSKVKQSDKDSKVKRKEDASASKSCSEEKVVKDTKAELKSLAAKAVEEKDYAAASKLYSEAIKVDPKDAALYSNRSLCHLRCGEAHDALVDADACIRLRPDWPKGYCRKGAALTALKDHKESCDAYMAAVKLDPANQEVHEAFWGAVAAMKEELGVGQSGSSSDSD